ncbi:MAG: hypothetical protein R2748_10485 [Bryobacterales bacterium]
MAVEAGMIRVLATEQGRRAPLPANEDTALVIGNPPTEYASLPGAADEARLVHQRLLGHGVDVTALIGRQDAQPQAVVVALFARKYRIVHDCRARRLSGAGEWRKPARAGVILGEGIPDCAA